MLEGLADTLIEKSKADWGIIGRREGVANTGWLLLDFGDVIVHLFSPEQRDYYRIEQLWDRGKILVRLQ
jgi:ribosome-associated protein